MSQHQVTTRQRRNVVLLDLDGTLTQSDPGIIACATKAFEELSLPVPDDQEMHRFIGPAIIESFRRNHMPDELLDRGVEIYREYYADKAVFDDPNNPGHKIPGRLYNSVYAGIPEQLRHCAPDGLGTWQSPRASRNIRPSQCASISISIPWSTASTAPAQTTRASTRTRVIRYCFDSIGFDADAGDRALMVGDRWTDVDGAIACGLDCLGCRWGYAEAGELEEHGAYRIIDTVDELAAAVNDYFAK